MYVYVSPEVTTVTVGDVQSSPETVFTTTGTLPEHVFVSSSDNLLGFTIIYCTFQYNIYSISQ